MAYISSIILKLKFYSNFYKETFIEKSSKLHLVTYYTQPTTKKEKETNTVQKNTD